MIIKARGDILLKEFLYFFSKQNKKIIKEIKFMQTKNSFLKFIKDKIDMIDSDKKIAISFLSKTLL